MQAISEIKNWNKALLVTYGETECKWASNKHSEISIDLFLRAKLSLQAVTKEAYGFIRARS